MKVTSRERPNSLLQCVKKYIEMATDPDKMVWLFTFDTDDQLTTPIIKELPKNSEIVFGKSFNKIHAINRDVNQFDKRWDVLLNISDDQLPVVKGYDDIIRRSMPSSLNASLWFNDGWQNRINTQEILGFNYYQRTKKIYNSEYKSFFCDNESTIIAERLGFLVRSNECIIKHFHPGWDKSQKHRQDNLYKSNDKYWNEDQETFNKRKAINFGL